MTQYQRAFHLPIRSWGCKRPRLQLQLYPIGFAVRQRYLEGFHTQQVLVLLGEVGLVLTTHSVKCFSGQEDSDVAMMSSTAPLYSVTGKGWGIKAEVVSKVCYVASCV
jgi:hypothetical protein